MQTAIQSLLANRFKEESRARRSRRRFLPSELCQRGSRIASQQLAFVEDASRWKVACCSRRAGKTHACAILLLAYALEVPESLCLYVTLTRLSGKRIVWKRLLKLNREYDIGGEVNRGELTVVLPNGSEIRVMGCKDETEADKLRGIDPAPRLVVIDEAQAFKPYVQELVEDALEPMLLETKGTMVLIGTPGPVRSGYFYEACRAGDPALLERTNVEPVSHVASEKAGDDGGKPWSVHHWTIEQNPFIDDVNDELAALRARKGWAREHPTYQREYLGRWVTEHDALVYKFDHARNGYSALPDHAGSEWRCVLVVDQGYVDADCIGALWFRPHFPGVWLEELHHERKASAGELVTAAVSHWAPVKGRCIGIVWDEGGGGKKVAEDARKQGLPVEPAEKGAGSKVAGVELVNSALLTGCLLVPLDGHAAYDASRVTWDPKARGVKFSERYHTDMWDVVVYGMRKLVGLIPLDRKAELPVAILVDELAERARSARIRSRGVPKDWVKTALGGKR